MWLRTMVAAKLLFTTAKSALNHPEFSAPPLAFECEERGSNIHFSRDHRSQPQSCLGNWPRSAIFLKPEWRLELRS
jgi:hypothetical protein